MIALSRRRALCLIAAPAIVRATSLMPIKTLPEFGEYDISHMLLPTLLYSYYAAYYEKALALGHPLVFPLFAEVRA